MIKLLGITESNIRRAIAKEGVSGGAGSAYADGVIMAENTQHQEQCGNAPLEAVLPPPGIVHTALDEGPVNALTVDYDPRRISKAGVMEVIEQLAPEAQARFGKCLMRMRGRACEACALNFERKAMDIPGIRRARATFIGGVMTVTYDEEVLPPSEVVRRVRETGAPVTPLEPSQVLDEPAPWTLRWFAGAGLEFVFTVLTLVFLLAGWLVSRAHPAVSVVLFTGAYLAGGWFGAQAGWQSLRERKIDIDLLMILAALGAASIGAMLEGSVLLFLFSLSNVLQGLAIERTRKAIHSLMKLRPAEALTRRAGGTILLPIGDLVVGDIVIVRPGEGIPLDAVIVQGESSVDQSSLTGESLPVFKKPGDEVFAGTINQSGGLEILVSKLARESSIEKLIRLVEEAQSEKAGTQRFLEVAEQYYAMGVIAFTLALIAVPAVFMHEAFRESFYRAMTVMVVASPCALIISTPASILSAIGGAARRGVLFKGGAHLERTSTVKVVAFDKTGTLTEGKPRVTDVIAGRTVVSFKERTTQAALDLLQLVAAVEVKSEHPLGLAMVTEAKQRGLELPECADFVSFTGKGAAGWIGARRIAVGNARLFEAFRTIWPANVKAQVEALQNAGKTCVLVGELAQTSQDAVILGAVAIADTLRADAAEVVKQLKRDGVDRVVMLTGDHHRVAAAIAAEAGVDEFYADLLPEDKVRVIASLKNTGPVAMVGDGVNDAPALASATVGIAMGAGGTDIAMETADLVLMSNNLANIPFAIAISKQARRVIIQNLVLASGVIAVLVASALGLHLPLPIGVVGHEGSTVLVCLNGLRMLAFRASAK